MAASMEPKLTPKEDFKARRLEAIKAKGLEIKEVVRFAPQNNPIFSEFVSNVFVISEPTPVTLVTLSLVYCKMFRFNQASAITEFLNLIFKKSATEVRSFSSFLLKFSH